MRSHSTQKLSCSKRNHQLGEEAAHTKGENPHERYIQKTIDVQNAQRIQEAKQTTMKTDNAVNKQTISEPSSWSKIISLKRFNFLNHRKTQTKCEIPYYLCQHSHDEEFTWQQMLRRMQGKGNLYTLKVAVKTGTIVVQITTESPKEARNVSPLCLSNNTPRHFPKTISYYRDSRTFLSQHYS